MDLIRKINNSRELNISDIVNCIYEVTVAIMRCGRFNTYLPLLRQLSGYFS